MLPAPRTESPQQSGWISSAESLKDKNHALICGAADIFGLHRPWDVIKAQNLSRQRQGVLSVHRRVWRPSTDLDLSLLPEPGSALRALYLGEYALEVIIQNVCRFGLYSDEIILINPFDNPNLIAENFNPLVHPEEWIEETLKVLYQLMAMAPWVEKGFVTFIPNPGDFDRPLLMKTAQLAEQRTKGTPVTDRDVDESILKQHMMRKLLACPPDYIADTYREMKPAATDEEVAGLIDYVESERKRDPFLMDGTMDKLPAQFMTTRSGASLEMGMYICQAIGAFPYTNYRYRWNEILGAREQFDSTMETWTPLTKAFQNLDFKFLDSVDPNFALEMRTEQRLGGFRSYLRKVWNAVEGSPDPANADALARDFSDELTQSYQDAKKESSEIDIDLLKWVGGGGVIAGAGAAASALTTGGLSLALPTAGFVINSVAQLLQSTMKRRNFRKTVPMSAFIDLERKARPGATGY